MKDLLNEKVDHIMFGRGITTEIKDQKIYIQFQNSIGTKAFLYPEAFGKFLKAVNPTVENYILKEVSKKQDQIELERKEKEQKSAKIEEELEKLALKSKKSVARSRKRKF